MTASLSKDERRAVAEPFLALGGCKRQLWLRHCRVLKVGKRAQSRVGQGASRCVSHGMAFAIEFPMYHRRSGSRFIIEADS